MDPLFLQGCGIHVEHLSVGNVHVGTSGNGLLDHFGVISEDAKKKADFERDRATGEQKKASELATILGMRVLNMMKPAEDPIRVIEDTRKQIDAEERQLKTADETAAYGIKLDLAYNYRVLADLLIPRGCSRAIAA